MDVLEKKVCFETLRRDWQSAQTASRVGSPFLGRVEAAGIDATFSRHLIDQPSWLKLLQGAERVGLRQYIEAAFSGEVVNHSECRAALHSALRRPVNSPLLYDGVDVMQQIESVLGRMEDLVQRLHRRELLGAGGKAVTDVIHLGIGGSDLGPLMLHHALQPYKQTDVQFHFFGNVDRGYLQQRLSKINTASTMVIVVSKSFTTYETLTNARWVREWMQSAGISSAMIDSAFYAVTAHVGRALESGVDEARILPLWDWVGGRFSLWSAVSLSVAMAIGMENFRLLLAGAYAMDEHFQSAPWSSNLPIIMGLLGVWYGSVLQAPTQAIMGYSEYLRYFKDYCQQQQMESLGKSVSRFGEALAYSTGRVIWGGVGSNTQHSFHQLLMQGTHLVPVDFILPLHGCSGERNDDLIANCLAQAEVLWNGEGEDVIRARGCRKGISETMLQALLPHQEITGGQPSTVLMMDSLSPSTLGALIALYEHSVLVKSVMWGINPFDQWGVESGKVMANGILAALRSMKGIEIDDSITRELLQHCGVNECKK